MSNFGNIADLPEGFIPRQLQYSNLHIDRFVIGVYSWAFTKAKADRYVGHDKNVYLREGPLAGVQVMLHAWGHGMFMQPEAIMVNWRSLEITDLQSFYALRFTSTARVGTYQHVNEDQIEQIKFEMGLYYAAEVMQP